MITELLLAATIVAGAQDRETNDDRYVSDRIYSYVTSRSDNRQARCALAVAYKESRYRRDASNGKYWGIFQLGFAYPTKPHHYSIKRQLSLADRYVQHRYGNWCNAWQHHILHNWY